VFRFSPVLWFFAAVVLARGAAEGPKLTIERAMLHQSEDGAVVPSDFPFAPGDIVYFSCQLGGYKKIDKDFDRRELHVTYSVEARDARGVLLAPEQSEKIATTVTAEDKDWMPKIRFSVVVPPFAASGEYQILVKAKDQNSGSEAEAKKVFTVQGRDVPPSETLVVRNFRFLRGEDDQQPLELAAYRPGDMVWARFDMTGYKLGEKNRLDVEYGLTVLRPDGDTTYSQPRAAEEKSETFYPQRYTPGVLSLSLPKDVKAGQYSIVLTVRDNVGGQTYEAREKFSVE
jgi:hypothetical protein